VRKKRHFGAVVCCDEMGDIVIDVHINKNDSLLAIINVLE
jgi:hypothetical protein